MQYDKQNKTLTLSQNTGVTFSIALLVLLGSGISGISIWTSNIQDRVARMEELILAHDKRISANTKDSVDSQIKFAEIQTQLKSIDASLIEIKQALRE